MRALNILFFLFVASVMISQSLMDLFSTLLCVQWVSLVWKSRQSSSSQKLFQYMGLEKWWIAWLVVVILGFALHWTDTSYALERIIEFKWILIFYVLFQVLIELKPDRRILSFLLYFILAVSIVTLFLYFAEWDVLAPWRYGVNDFVRAGGFFGNPMTFAHSFVILLSLLVGLFMIDFAHWQKSQKILAFVVLFLALASLMLTFTRGVWIGFTVGLAAGLLLWRPRYLLILVLTLICGFWISYMASPQFRYRIDVTASEVGGFSERKLIWKAHWIVFKENPILGAGYGQNSKQLPRVYAQMGAPENTLVAHAHNQYLHLAAGTGLLGLFCYLVIWTFFLKRTFAVWKCAAVNSWDKGISLGLFMGQIAFLTGGLTEANFEHSKVRFMVMLAWAYVIYLSKKYSEELVSNRKIKL